jgi:hypothetical protein
MPKLKPVTIIYIAMAVCLGLITIIYPISVGSSMQEVSWCNENCITGTYITSLILGIMVLFLIVLRCVFNSS